MKDFRDNQLFLKYSKTVKMGKYIRLNINFFLIKKFYLF